MLTNDYIRNLLRVRKETLKMTWEEIAEKADVATPTIYKFVYNQTKAITIETLVKVLDAMGMELTIKLKDGGEKP